MPKVILFGFIIIAGLIAAVIAIVIGASKKNKGESGNTPIQTYVDKRFCRFCGTQVPADSVFCTKCGSNIASAHQSSITTQTQPSYQPQVCQTTSNPAQTELPMNWFKFLIYFSFFAGAAINVITAIMYFTGAYYQGFSGFIYSTAPELKTLDTLIGIMNLGAAVFAIIARFKLSGFKKSGPMCVYILYAIGALIYVVYGIGIMSIFSKRLSLVSSTLAPSIYTTVIMNIVICSCMIFVNHLYFKKRKFMFIK